MSYPRSAFAEQNTERLWQLINEHPLATLVVPNSETPFVHMSLSLNNERTHLLGHANPANPLTQLDKAQLQVLFRGPDAYLSPSQVAGIMLPTWDYATVHISGQLREITHPDDKYAAMQCQLKQFESPANPWDMSMLSENQIAKLFSQLFFFSIEIASITGTFKLSQNKSNDTRQAIAHLLEVQGNPLSRYYQQKTA
ncbi:FMN-binding negative transcriptional regulator [Pseudoalteromonas sp. DL2-H2.2]|uniref:FMN-binding negative transcriptional regulator n=1 Tax=Pseudoalteromonas sp. DL2-H2.2 TaxID=2908889 RepID=UPI001F4392A8|nr:FMN-binding negative transcriptional regulator [Pseudoalteromonas sp. DL2-H2.2]MCF2909553.1 FMN-binding negative transcriptional regulator [Pseudoalteromonas sp. DL2-H2.2]